MQCICKIFDTYKYQSFDINEILRIKSLHVPFLNRCKRLMLKIYMNFESFSYQLPKQMYELYDHGFFCLFVAIFQIHPVPLLIPLINL